MIFERRITRMARILATQFISVIRVIGGQTK